MRAGEVERDHKFHHELFPTGRALISLANRAVSDLLSYEEREGVRRRKRKPDAHRGLVNAVYVIVANLARRVLFPGDGGGNLILPLGHPKRAQVYPTPMGFGKDLAGTVEGLVAIGMASLHRPHKTRHATTIAPSMGFRSAMLASGVTGADIGRRKVPDRLRLSRKEGGVRLPIAVPKGLEAELLRGQVDTINDGLVKASIAYLGNTSVDVGDRFMVRHFSHPVGVDHPSFDYGGRLFGGCWQNMGRNQRQNLRIDGEAVAELDYGQVFPRLAYALAGAAPPEDDLYLLPELMDEQGSPYREGVKRGMNALLWGTRRWNDEITPLLPKSWTSTRLRKALSDHHPAIAHLLTPEAITGHRLSRMESNIIVAVTLACLSEGITALPIHDAVLVPVSKVSVVREIMAREALAVAGVSLPVSLKA